MEEFQPRNDELLQMQPISEFLSTKFTSRSLMMIFNTEEAHDIIKDCIEGVLGKADYNHDSVNKWTAAIVEQSLTHLVKLGKTYKYIVTCAVMQKCGAGLHTASSCFWDTTTDGKYQVAGDKSIMYLHSQMGKQNNELCGQCLCCGHNLVANRAK